MWTLTRALLMLRKNTPALSVGSWHLVEGEGRLLAYERRDGDTRVLVALNLGATPVEMNVPHWAAGCRSLLSTLAGATGPVEGLLRLRGNEGMILGTAA